MNILEENKATVKRFNKEVIEESNLDTFNILMHKDFINKSAPLTSNGAEGMWHTFNNILKPAFPDLKVEIYEQIAEGDKVTTRKAIIGTHEGMFMDIKPTNKKIKIDVIDIVTLRNGKYFEHWGLNTLQNIILELKK